MSAPAKGPALSMHEVRRGDEEEEDACGVVWWWGGAWVWRGEKGGEGLVGVWDPLKRLVLLFLSRDACALGNTARPGPRKMGNKKEKGRVRHKNDGRPRPLPRCWSERTPACVVRGEMEGMVGRVTTPPC